MPETARQELNPKGASNLILDDFVQAHVLRFSIEETCLHNLP